MAMTRDCFDPVWASSLFLLIFAGCGGVVAALAVADDVTGRFRDLDIGILRSVKAACAASPKPRFGHLAGGA
jgi:hypothetical protein